MRTACTVALLVFALFSAGACEGTDAVLNEARIWVSIDPIQCNGNAWDPFGVTPEDYYRRWGVVIHASVTIQAFDAVCLACSCPNGDRVFLQIDEGRLAFMLREGFVLAVTPWGNTTRSR